MTGITAMIGGVRLKMRSGLNAGAATASPMIAQSPATAARAAGPRRPKRDRCDFASSATAPSFAIGSTFAVWADNAANARASEY